MRSDEQAGGPEGSSHCGGRRVGRWVLLGLAQLGASMCGVLLGPDDLVGLAGGDAGGSPGNRPEPSG